MTNDDNDDVAGLLKLVAPSSDSLLPPWSIRKAKLDSWRGQVRLHEQFVESLVVRTDREAKDAADRCKDIKLLAKDIEQARKDAVSPLLDAQRQVNAAAKPLLEALGGLETRVKGMILTWQSEKEIEAQRAREARQREAREAEDRGLRAAAEGDEVGFAAAATDAEIARGLAKVEGKAPTSTGLSYGRAWTRESWAWEVEDLAKVPREYLILDTRKLNAIGRSSSEPPEIPGIVWSKKKTVSVR